MKKVTNIEKPTKQTSIDEWRKEIENNFPALLNSAEIGLKTLSQMLINDISNPFGVVFVDAPSAGKTITLNFFKEIDLVYTTDNFTPASFVSQSVNVKKADLPKIDLLPKITNKLFLVRDLAPVFASRAEDIQKNIGILTRVFDGEGYKTEGGVHGGRGYEGDYFFLFMAASTPISWNVWKLMGSFGSRLFFVPLNSTEKDEDALADQLIDTDVREKEKECRLITKDLVATLWEKYPDGIDWDKTKDPKNLRKLIAKASKLLARLRGTISVYESEGGDSNYNHSIPTYEMPDRINQLLYNFARGHALACGRENINEEDIKLVMQLAIGSAAPTRTKIFTLLLKNEGLLTTEEAIKQIGCSRPTAHKQMEMLKLLKIADIEQDGEYGEKSIRLKGDLDWFISDEYKDMMGYKTEIENPKEPKMTICEEPEAETTDQTEEPVLLPF